jgi:thioesterase domain-containing protein
VDALVALQAESLGQLADDAPFVLAGHSSGGLVAHAVAIGLEKLGRAPAGVVLLDTPTFERNATFEEYWPMLPGRVLAESDQQADAGEDAWLTAMAHYFSLAWTEMDETSLQTLHVRADEPLFGSADGDDWKPVWKFSGNVTVVDVPGNHFTMMTEHAVTTAQVVSDWIAELKE